MMTPPESTQPTVTRSPAGQGQVLNVLGCRLTAKTRCRESGDAVFLSECAFGPGIGPPLHTHPQWESFYMLEGTVEFGFIDGEKPSTLVARRGDVVTIPSNAPHSFKNVGPDVARMLVIGESGLEAFFYDAGLGAPDGPPTEAEIGRVVGVMQKHGQTIVGPHPGS